LENSENLKNLETKNEMRKKLKNNKNEKERLILGIKIHERKINWKNLEKL
jgi:hypothetical protein